MSFTHTFIALCVVLFHLTSATVYRDCGTNAATLQSFDVSGCPQDTVPCPLKRNTNVSLAIALTPTQDAADISNYVFGIIEGVKVPFPTEKDACKGNIPCPVKNGMATKYNLVIFVSTQYPKLRLVVDIEVKTDDGKYLICAVFPAEITD